MFSIPSEYLAAALAGYEQYRDLGARAIAQVSDEDLLRAPGPESNSIAVLVKHLRGNFLSRWTDFRTTDGEKPDRDRDAEFDAASVTRAEVEAWWDEGFEAAFGAVLSLRPTELTDVITIRGRPLTVLQAVERNLLHTAYHVGQIVLLAKHFGGDRWESLTVPRAAAEPSDRT